MEYMVVAAVTVSLCVVAPATTTQDSAPHTAAGTTSRTAQRPVHVLVLYQQQLETRPMLEFGEALRAALRTQMASPVEFYQESLDSDRFAEREGPSSLTSYFGDKYGQLGIDVIVPVGSRALSFAVERLRGMLPNIPIVFALTAVPQTDPALLPSGVTGRIASASRFEPTLSLARRLQPDAERIVIIGGAGAADSESVAVAVKAATARQDSLPIVVLRGLTLDTLLRRVHEIPRRSIVLFVSYRQDGRGQAFEPLDIVGSIARATSAPMYTQLRSYVGEGVVGGAVTRFDDEGFLTGQLVARVLRRPPGAPLPPIEAITNTFVMDWRQLRHWSLAEDRLPPGTDVLFREPTLWQRYRTPVLLAVALVCAESVLIGLLLIERRLRKRAQQLAEERQRGTEEARRQIAHMGRLAVIGELAATISHELRQPLAAIRANAETGAKLTGRGGARMDADERALYGDIFADIISDDQLASDIISRVRALARDEDLPQRSVDLNEVCLTAARLLNSEAIARHAELELSLDPRLPAIVGDATQLQQVVLNLALNALDVSAASNKPRVTITTVGRNDEVEIAVHDSGPGIPADVQQHLFQSFFTTKPAGLGLGLAIVRSIVERHQGKVRADNSDDGGAIFRVVMPRHNRIRSADADYPGPKTPTLTDAAASHA
jgi:signal transduction histidine kinase